MVERCSSLTVAHLHYCCDAVPDINNEKTKKNELYTQNLGALERLVLFKFMADTTGRGRIWAEPFLY